VKRDDFLKLLVAQLAHQDPLQPQSDTAFVAQLAQFAQLEQSQNQTELLGRMQGQLASQTGSQAVALVGREITARFDTILVGGGRVDPLQFVLDGPAKSVTLTIKDPSGRTVRTIKTGPLGAGHQSLSWDGRTDGGVALPAGSYRVAVAAEGAAARSEIKGAVTGVSFADGRPVLLVGGARVQLGDVIMVSK
jgi:flagellar basal-body rod modification protein FlgD